ncbi:sensor histidine kinase [Candidatus Stoquefichus massiliensis]|uniref:sensor histidine kinase n=1 Tax=Candidatus Stoquefichus massiliensis TaxID=1470350 RepID=UPI000489DD69|nr:GHKL domain-containing protein [Candidatus Stoquefichus massiliensis]
MNMLINLIIGIILSLIDLYLIELYLNVLLFKQQNTNFCNKTIIHYLIPLTLLFISNCITMNYVIKIILFIVAVCCMIFKYIKINFSNVKNTFYFIMLRIVINITITLLFSWILNIPIKFTTYHHLISYNLLVNLLERYTMFLGMISNFKISFIQRFSKFKIITIILFTYFAITILFNNQSLFYFPDVGRTFVFVIFISIASLIFFDRYQVKHEKIERDLIITTQNITKEKEYLKKYNDSADEVRRMRHNMHNDLNIIYGYLNSNEFDDAMKHVCHLLGNMDKTSSIIHVGHTSIDSIIDDKIKVMNTKGITYNEEIVSVNIGNIDVNTIAILLGLALDNAIEAAEKVDGYKEVKLEIKNCKEYLVLHIVNSIIPGSQPVFHKTSKLTDPLNHGYGVKQINHIAKQYDGNAKFEVSHCFVTLKIILDMKLNEDPSL